MSSVYNDKKKRIGFAVPILLDISNKKSKMFEYLQSIQLGKLTVNDFIQSLLYVSFMNTSSSLPCTSSKVCTMHTFPPLSSLILCLIGSSSLFILFSGVLTSTCLHVDLEKIDSDNIVYLLSDLLFLAVFCPLTLSESFGLFILICFRKPQIKTLVYLYNFTSIFQYLLYIQYIG